MTRLCILLGCVLSGLGGGCANDVPVTARAVLVPGAAGDGPWYAGLREGLGMGKSAGRVAAFHWGAPPPLDVLNLQDRSIHEGAEKDLARAIGRWRQHRPDGKLLLIGHSAGCGVILGALKRLDERVMVDEVVLLAPSVSPVYDLSPALRHILGKMHVFYSPRDTLWLGWRTSTFGTYDNVKTRAAGNIGFDVSALSQDQRDKVVQHAYRVEWEALDNNGGHFGWVARKFVAGVIAPLLER